MNPQTNREQTSTEKSPKKNPHLTLLPLQKRPDHLLLHLLQALNKLTRAELSLLKEDLKTSTLQATKHLALSFFFGFLAALSLLPFMAFLVISLASLLQGNYGLSSLILSIAFLSVGGLASYRSMMKLIKTDFKKESFRETLQSEVQIIRESLKPQATSSKQYSDREKRAAS